MAFAHELMSTDIQHTKDQFDAIIEANDDYHSLLEQRDMSNGVLDREMRYILELYDDCMRQNDFL